MTLPDNPKKNELFFYCHETVFSGHLRPEEDISGNRTNYISPCQATDETYSTRLFASPCRFPMISVAIFVGTSA